MILSDVRELYLENSSQITPRISNSILDKIILETVIEALDHEDLKTEWRAEQAERKQRMLTYQNLPDKHFEAWRPKHQEKINQLSEFVNQHLDEIKLEIRNLQKIRSAECANKIVALSTISQDIEKQLQQHMTTLEALTQTKLNDFEKWVISIKASVEKIKNETLELVAKANIRSKDLLTSTSNSAPILPRSESKVVMPTPATRSYQPRVSTLPSETIRKLSEIATRCLGEIQSAITKLRGIRSAESGNKIFALNSISDRLASEFKKHQDETKEFDQSKIEAFQHWVASVETQITIIKKEVVTIEEQAAQRALTVASPIDEQDEDDVTPVVIISTPAAKQEEGTAPTPVTAEMVSYCSQRVHPSRFLFFDPSRFSATPSNSNNASPPGDTPSPLFVERRSASEDASPGRTGRSLADQFNDASLQM